MKKLLITIGLAIFMLGCISADALYMKNEPQEIHGLKFGSLLSNIPDMQYENARYFRENENLSVFDIPVTAVIYKFYQEQLYEITFLFTGIHNYHAFRSVLHNKHGLSLGAQSMDLGFWTGDIVPMDTNKEAWSGKKVYIHLEYQAGNGMLQYQYLPILNKLNK